MIFPPESLLRQREQILRRLAKGELPQIAAIAQLHALWPDDAVPYALQGEVSAAAGDFASAESSLWNALERSPCNYFVYSSLAENRLSRDPGDPLGKHVRCMALRKLALSSRIPKQVVEHYRAPLEKTGADPADPLTYEVMAEASASALAGIQLSSDDADRLLPFKLLDDLQQQAEAAVDAATLERILEGSARLVPIWRAALREWACHGERLSPDMLDLVVATLGEMAGPDILDDLLELASHDSPELTLHVHWATHRVAARFPAEALEHFRAAVPTAPIELRCAIAEQIVLLPPTPGREDVLAGMLDGLTKFSHAPDAAYLLMTVVYGIDEAGDEARAEHLLSTSETALAGKARKQLRKMMETDFTPSLLSMGMDELDIEDICLERALMPPDEDDEDEDEGDDEHDGPRPPAVKPGRNDLCWCGSGKKYKKCHLAADEERERTSHASEDAERGPGKLTIHQKLLDKVMEAGAEWRSRSDTRRAQELYFGSADAMEEDEFTTSGFVEWFVYDYRPAGKNVTLVEEYLAKRGSALPPDERELLESWRGSRFGLFEVQQVEEGAGLELKDLFTGDTLFVHDVTSSRALVRWDAIFTRVEEYQGRWLFSGNGVTVPRTVLPAILSKIDLESREAGRPPADFVRANSHRWYRELRDQSRQWRDNLNVVNAEGDPLELCSATYALTSRHDVEQTLRGTKQFEDATAKDASGGLTRFAWFETTEGPRRSYGSIEISDSQLRLECNSRRRLQIGRQLLEKYAGSWLRHQADEFQSVKEALDRPRDTARPEPVAPPQARELVHKMKVEHYAKWADEPLPALGGKTPREAVKSDAGRRAVEDMLRMFENGEERERKSGNIPVDFTEIRRTLGLTGGRE